MDTQFKRYRQPILPKNSYISNLQKKSTYMYFSALCFPKNHWTSLLFLCLQYILKNCQRRTQIKNSKKRDISSCQRIGFDWQIYTKHRIFVINTFLLMFIGIALSGLSLDSSVSCSLGHGFLILCLSKLSCGIFKQSVGWLVGWWNKKII